MRRVVLDTNVFLDCWVFGDKAARALKDAIESRRVVAVRSADTDAELIDVLARPPFALGAGEREKLLAFWRTFALEQLRVAAGACAIRCADPDDQKFLDLAFAAQAHALFTKDKALLATATRAHALGLRVFAPSSAASARWLEEEHS